MGCWGTELLSSGGGETVRVCEEPLREAVVDAAAATADDDDD